MKQNYLLALAGALLLTAPASAQSWVDLMENPTANFYDAQNEFNNYWANRPVEKGKGYKQFKRWEHFMEPRVYPTGNKAEASRAYTEFQNYLKTNPAAKQQQPQQQSANWTALGPFTQPTGGGGAGRVNFIRFGSGNTIFVGSPAGGLWRSDNGGTTWSTNTDTLAVIGCGDLAIDPTNSDIMYLATGDGEAGDTYSIGVLKTTDGGQNWSPTGLTWTVMQGRTIRRLLINPNDPQIVLAGTSAGVYRTTNGGTSWVLANGSTGIKDLEFKPGDPSVVYAANGGGFMRSSNSGATFAGVTNGVPASSGINRIEIGVTAANPDYVYLLAGKSSDSGFRGVYRSTDAGVSFTTQSTSPNILGWSPTGSDQGGQSWYDLALAVSPSNADQLVVGGVNLWRSSDGGVTWNLNGHWYGGGGVPYVHADIHSLEYPAGSSSTYYVGCDGGIFKTTNNGQAWTDISHNLSIGQMYRLGQSKTVQQRVMTGWQDNGSSLLSTNGWDRIIGGDGMECFIDWSNPNIIYGEYYNGALQRSTDGGQTFSDISQGINDFGAWVTPWVQDPINPQTIYAGFTKVWKSTNRGTTWTSLGTLPGGNGTIRSLAVAPSDPNIIYAARLNAIYRTSDGGATWNNVTGNLTSSGAAISYISVNPTNPTQLWVTLSGYTAGNKVFESSTGGNTWNNYSTGLPNLPANCITYQEGTSNGLYVGMDIGVYYRDNTLGSWIPYYTGMPNVPVYELEIFNFNGGKLRAATFGRGLWESDLYTSGTALPLALFESNQQIGCAGAVINFSDLSAGSPTSWSWSFPGGTPSTSTAQNPTVTYATPGVYSVTLTVSNANGADTKTRSGYITISAVQQLPLSESFETNPSFPPANWFNQNGDWAQNNNVGGFGLSNHSVSFDNYNIDLGGGRSPLFTPKYDLSGLTTATLSFQVAYARYNAQYSDSLAVLVSTDCGATFNQVFLKGGTPLATAPDKSNSEFVPTAQQWRTEVINMDAYAGQPNVTIVFENIGHYGQMLYLDNINLSAQAVAIPQAAFIASDTTVCRNTPVTFTDQSTNSPTSYQWTFNGASPNTSALPNPTVNYFMPGTHEVVLTVSNANGGTSLTKTSYITVYNWPNVTLGTQAAACAADTSRLLTGGNPAGGIYSGTGVANGYFDPAVAGVGTHVITYTYTDANGCSRSATQNLSVGTCLGMEEAVAGSILVAPNPTTGLVKIAFNTEKAGSLEIRLTNVLGQNVYQEIQAQSTGEFSKQLDLSKLANGIYMLHIEQGGHSALHRIVVQH